MKSPPALYAWVAWVLLFVAAVVMLGGISASQRFCGRTSADAITTSGGAAYFAPIPCDKLYRYPWFITWYLIAMTIIVPIVLAQNAVHSWRVGLVGLLLPLTYVLMQTANAFFLQKQEIPSETAASKTVFAGAVIGSVASYILILVLGTRDERPKSTDV